MKAKVSKAWADGTGGKAGERLARQRAINAANSYWAAKGKPNFGVPGATALASLKDIPEHYADYEAARLFHRHAPTYQRGTFAREWNQYHRQRQAMTARPSELAMAEASQRPGYKRKGLDINGLMSEAIIETHNALANRGAKPWAIPGADVHKWAQYLQKNHRGGPCDVFLRKASKADLALFAKSWESWANQERAKAKPSERYPELDKARRGREMADTIKPFLDWLETVDYSLARMTEDGEARPVKMSQETLTELCQRFLGFDVKGLVSEMERLTAELENTKEGGTK